MIQASSLPPLAHGDFDAWISVTAAESAAVQQLLPAGFELAAQDIAPDGYHPLIILAGRQTNVRSRFNGHVWLSYLEAGVMIPFVTCSAIHASPMSSFRASLYLDQNIPILLGRLLGIGKRIGTMARDRNSMLVSTSEDGQVFNSQFTPHGAFSRPQRNPWFTAVRSLFEQVHLGYALAAQALPVVRVYCDLNFRRGYVRAVDAEFEVAQRFCSAVPENFGVRAMDRGPFGAFQLRTRWTMRCLV